MYFKRGPRCRGPPCKIYPLLLFQLVIRGDAGLVKNRIMYAPDINGRRLFSACLRREGGRGRARRWTGGGIKAGFLRRGKRWGRQGTEWKFRRRFRFSAALVQPRSNYIYSRSDLFSPISMHARSLRFFFLYIRTFDLEKGYFLNKN